MPIGWTDCDAKNGFVETCGSHGDLTCDLNVKGENIDMAEDSSIERKRVKVVIAVPNEGSTHYMAYDNRMLMMIHLGTLAERSKHEPVTKDGAIFEFFHFTAGRLLTPAARECLADHALNSGMDYMLMIDDDMTTPIDMFERLYNHNVDIVAPLAFTRNPPHMAVIYNCETGNDPVTKNDYFINHYVRNYPENKLVRCDAVGFGSALIKMDVIARMKKPYFMSTCGTGEDILFCYNAQQQAGAKVYMDTTTKLGHIGAPLVIDEAYAKWYWETQEKKDVKKEHSVYTKYDVKEAVAV